MQDGNGDGIGDGKGNENGEERVGGEEFWYPPNQERSRVEVQALLFCTSHYSIIAVDRRWRLQVVSSFGRKTRRVPDDEIPRGEQGTRDGRKETVTRTGTGARTSTGMSTRAEMGVRTGAGTGTRIEMRVEGRESPRTYEVVLEVGRKT